MPYARNPDDDIRIYYEVEGQGPPLLLYHPTTSSSADFRDVGYVDRLKDRFQVISLDCRAHGQSDSPHDEAAYELVRLVGDVVAVLDEIDIEATHFYGYSLGGRVGFGLGYLFPERVRSLILAGGSYLPEPDFSEAMLASLEKGGMPQLVEDIEARMGEALSPAFRARLLEMDAKAFIAYIRQTRLESGLEHALPDMNVPVLLINVGHHPERYDQLRRASTLLPNARLIENPGGDDDILYWRTDLIAPLIIGFVDEINSEH